MQRHIAVFDRALFGSRNRHPQVLRYPSDSYITERYVHEGATFIGSVDRYGTLVHVFEVFE